jgi:hypothetical protein
MPQKILFVFCFCLGIFHGIISQRTFTEIDSLRPSYSVAGKLSTIDLSSGYSLTTLGFASNQPFLFDPHQLLYSGLPFKSLESTRSIRYTSLPHLGFAYTFGSSGFQFAKFQYSQAFAKNWIINLDYNNQQTNGILRNSAVRNQLITLKLAKRTKVIESLFTADYSIRSFAWNGGIVDDSLALNYSPELIPVNKDEAISTRKEALVSWSNYLNFLADSTKKTGLYFTTNFDSKNRRFRETGDLASQYSTIYVDSFETNDHLQISSQTNELGIFTKRNKWNFTLGALENFWNYRNGLFYRDTIELDLAESFNYKSNTFYLNQKFNFNLIGRGQSWKNEISAEKKWLKSNIKINWKIENSFPDLFQRHYFSNTVKYQLSTYELQFKNKLDVAYTFQLWKKDFSVKAGHVYLRNPYFFNGTTWINSQINEINSLNASFKMDLNYKSFTFSPSYSFYSLPATWKFYPTHLVKFRITSERGVLKKRKLRSYFGVEPQLISGFNPLVIYPALDVFILNSNPIEQQSYIDLSVFAGFELKGVKFFAKAENLGYFWNSRMLQLVQGYPIPPMQIQIGITWDFWN